MHLNPGSVALTSLVGAALVGLAVASPRGVTITPLPLRLPTVDGQAAFEPDRIPLGGEPARFTLTLRVPEPGITEDGAITVRLPAQVAALESGEALAWCPQMPLWVKANLKEPDEPSYLEVEPAEAVDVGMVGLVAQARLLLGLLRGQRTGELDYSLRERLCAANRIVLRPRRGPWPGGMMLTLSFGAPGGPGWPLPGQPTDLFAAISLDVKGDGEERMLTPAPELRFVAGPPVALRLLNPSIAHPGERVVVHLAGIDAGGWPTDLGGLAGGPEPILTVDGLEAPAPAAPPDWAEAGIPLELPAGGPYRVSASVGALRGEGPPLLVDAAQRPVFWGDLHRHSILADGWALPREVLRHALEEEGLDYACLSEHSHPDPMDRFGILRRRVMLSPEEWGLILEATSAFNTPGAFTTVAGYEWSSLAGHRNVYVPEVGILSPPGMGGDIPLRPFYAAEGGPPPMTPSELLASLKGEAALVIPHHSGFRRQDGEPFDWGPVEADSPQRLVEVYSEHGNSETWGGPRILHGQTFDTPPNALIRLFLGQSVLGPWDRADPGDGSWVEDALAAGHRMGLIAGSDTHFTPRGPLSWPGGLSAVRAEANDRRALFEGLWRRDAWGTTGARMLLDLRPSRGGDDPRMLDAGSPVGLDLRVHGTAPLESVLLRRHTPTGYDVAWQAVAGQGLLAAEGARDVVTHLDLPPLAPGDFVYLRVTQRDGELGWFGPLWAADR